MPNSACDHERNRQKVCAPCGKKIIFGKKKSENRINEKSESLIKKFLNKDFSVQNEVFPTGICSTCRVTLQEYEKNTTKRTLPSMPNYSDIKLRKQTRSVNKNEFCQCYI